MKERRYDWVCTREMGSGAFGACYVEPCGLQPMAERPKRRRERRRAGRGQAVFGRYTGIGWRPFGGGMIGHAPCSAVDCILQPVANIQGQLDED